MESCKDRYTESGVSVVYTAQPRRLPTRFDISQYRYTVI